jgi:mannose-1-phosphate guanylyltransferase/mannose-6-phosphate isomerase
MIRRIIPAILSGGAGTRLWPLSTEARPKQFHALGGPETLFAATARRVRGDALGISFTPPIVLCNARHADLVRQNLDGAAAAIALEPVARNTAAAGAIAAALAAEIDSNALVLLLPADHLVADAAAFHAALARAARVANDRIVTLGITPDGPATGYGYIRGGGELADGVFAIEAFREKPDPATANAYVASGDYYWNAGMFLFQPATLLREFNASADIRDGAIEALQKSVRMDDEIRLDADAFARVRAAPLDIAVMEKTSRGAVVPCDIGWADIGSWDEVWRRTPRGADGSALLGSVAAADAAMIVASGVKAAVVDGDDLVAVATPRGIAILPREQVSDAASLLDVPEA